MPKLSELGLDERSTPAVDWDAPEAGQSPPAVYPGIYTLLFKMPDDPADWFDSMEAETVKGHPESKQKFLVLKAVPAIVAAHADRNAPGQPVPPDAEGKPLQLPPQRISFFKNSKMLISTGAELLRALGIRLEGNMFSQIEPALQQVNGRVSFMAEINWRAYFKSTDTTVATRPRSKKELAWPREADGKPTMLAVNPQTNEKSFGYPEISKIIPPQSAAS